MTGQRTRSATLVSPLEVLRDSVMEPLPFPFKGAVQAPFGNGRVVVVSQGGRKSEGLLKLQ